MTKPTGRRPGEARRHHHEAEDHNTAFVVKPDVGALGSVGARAGQRFIQALLEEESTSCEDGPNRPVGPPWMTPTGLRNGYGKPRRLSLTSGTITVRRPRETGAERTVCQSSRALVEAADARGGCAAPTALPAWASVGRLRSGPPRPVGRRGSPSPASLARLKAQWQLEYEAWKQRRLDDLEVV